MEPSANCRKSLPLRERASAEVTPKISFSRSPLNSRSFARLWAALSSASVLVRLSYNSVLLASRAVNLTAVVAPVFCASKVGDQACNSDSGSDKIIEMP